MCTKPCVGSTADTGSGQGGCRCPAGRLREAEEGWGKLGEAERLSSLMELSVSHISSMEATVPGAAPKWSL